MEIMAAFMRQCFCSWGMCGVISSGSSQKRESK
ncbi:hypothetical protein B23_1925 [Geobacillus thermoleovorans B23]|nr:hypothetical protein B23_1925 [Geobacillus thermoleovorans B23]